MSILDELENPTRRATSFPEWLIAQTPEVREALNKAAVNEAWSDYGLEQLLRKHGAPCSKESVKAWRADVASR